MRNPDEEASLPVNRTSRLLLFGGATLLCGLLAVTALLAGHRLARQAIVDIGPTDAAYASGFRDLERDGDIYFRWSTVPSSAVHLPVRFCGPGAVKMRIRRHFEDPALLTVVLNGAVEGTQSVRARVDTPYDISIFPVSKAICNEESTVTLESTVGNGRPMGVAVDWLAIESSRGFRPSRSALQRAAVAGGILGLVLIALGATLWLTLGGGFALSLGIGWLSFVNPVAMDRILTGGLPALLLTLGLSALLARFFGLSDLDGRARLTLLAITLATLVTRLAFLHPSAFYPDYRVHALVEETLSRGGLPAFLSNLFTIQYARSLGLQEIDGRWYPFPYPPGAYVAISWVAKVFGIQALDACVATAAMAAALLPLLAVVLARLLGLASGLGLWAGGLLVLHPLFVRRMALGYFPGVIGETVDTLALVVLLRLLAGRGRPTHTFLTLVAVLSVAFVVYTQSIANFGLLLSTLLVVEAIRRSPAASAVLRASLAATLAFALSFLAFYSIYLPVFRNIHNGERLPESAVLERLENSRSLSFPAEGLATDDDDRDPFVGTKVNPLRGAGRLAARLWRFHGPFALFVLPGLWWLWRPMRRADQNLVLAWLSIPLWINLMAAGLPSPNGFQHLKDFEFATPLLAIGLAVARGRIAARSQAAAAIVTLAWIAYAAFVATAEFSARLLRLGGL